MPSPGTIALTFLLFMFLYGTVSAGRDFFKGDRESGLAFVLAGLLSAVTISGLL